MNWQSLNTKKKSLDALRPLKPALMQNLEEWFRVELTYTSNAIEGNTLTRQETAVVLEKGITIGGRTMREHLEATNHAQALDWLKDVAASPRHPVGEREILRLHETIMKNIDDVQAGRYRTMTVRISGSRVVLPNARKVPELVKQFASWLKSFSTLQALYPAELAAQAHYRLVSIHPFVDGNGRTARLLMNLVLMQRGFPPVFIRPGERLAYLNGLEKAQLGGSLEDYESLMIKIMDRSLEIYMRAAKGESPAEESQSQSALLRIGALAKATKESTSTLRHWTKEGLLKPADHTESGYTLYPPEAVNRIELIRELQAKRLSLQEIKRELEGKRRK